MPTKLMRANLSIVIGSKISAKKPQITIDVLKTITNNSAKEACQVFSVDILGLSMVLLDFYMSYTAWRV